MNEIYIQMDKEKVKEKVAEITENHTLILSMEDAEKYELQKAPGNGAGGRDPGIQMFIYTSIYASKREPMTYPKCYDEIIELDEKQLIMIDEYKTYRRENNLRMGNTTIGFIIHGENNEGSKKPPIREDIKKHYKKYPCLHCGSKKTFCDHKNDLYNDERVLNKETQSQDDFQAFCNSCNLRKRAVALKRDKEKKRQPPPPSILEMNGGIKFTQGDETYDPDDKDAMVGTYWHDPMDFSKKCERIISQKQWRYYT